MTATALPAADTSPALTAGERRRLSSHLALAFLAWGSAVAIMSASGALAALPTLLLPVAVAGGIVAPLVPYARNERFRRLVWTTDIRLLTVFNVWRIPAAAVFFLYGGRGELPAVFVGNAGWGDIAAGVLAAAAVVAFGADVERHRRGYLAVHLFSFGDFVVAVGTGFVLTVTGNPLMATLTQWPIALIPLFGVPLTGAVTLMVLHRLLADRGSPAAGQP